MATNLRATITEWALLISGGTMGVAVVAGLLYMAFFYGSISEHKAEKALSNAVDTYAAKPNQENAKRVISSFKQCDELVHKSACNALVAENETLAATALQYGHIDLFFNEDVYVDESFIDNLTKAWTKYSGSHWAGNIKKAAALSRQAKYKDAIAIYKTLYKNHKEFLVATHIKEILKHYGCTDDVSIWSEFGDPRMTNSFLWVNPGATPFPDQPPKLTANEIADRRIALRQGDFVDFTDSCPLNKFLK